MTQTRMTYRMPLLAGGTSHAIGKKSWLNRAAGMDAWELHVTRSGVGVMGRKPDAARIVTGDFLLFPPGTPHDYGSDPEHGWAYQWVYFHPKSEWQELLNVWPTWVNGIMRLHPPKGMRAKLETLFDELIIVSRSQQRRRLMQSLNLVERVLLLLDTSNPLSQAPLADARIVESLDYMDENYAQPLTVSDLAELACLSPSRFAVLFKEEVGVSPMRHLERIRVERAAELLLRGDAPVGEIAAAVGFKCPFYFSRVFRNRTGASPRTFRNQGGWPIRPIK